MKKKVLSIALIAMSLVSFAGMAQNVSGQNSSKAKIENVKKDKADRKGGDKDGKKGEGRMMKGKKDPYAGLNLTDAQKEQLQQLDAKRKEARKERKMARKEEKSMIDSVKRAERKADKMNYLEEVKAIIGPDQYVVFLENFYMNGKQGKAMKQMKRDTKKDSEGKHHAKADRGAKSNRTGKGKMQVKA